MAGPKHRLTDAQLRASPIPVAVDGVPHVVIDSMPAGGAGLTDAELRASAVPVSVAGVATAANQATEIASLASVDGKLPALVGGRVPVVLPAGGGGLTDTELRAAAVPVSLASVPTHAVTGSFWQATQPVSAASLPLPAGASTSAAQGTGNTSLGNIDTKTPALVSGRVPVDGSGVTQPVSGTFWQATQPVSAASLPLPSGASTEATLALIKAKTDNLDVALSTRAVTGLTDAQIRATALPVSGTVTATGPLTDAQLRAANVPVQLKDAGRVRCMIKYHGTSAATADTLQSLTKNLGGTETAGTSTGVTSGKRLKITAVVVNVKAGAAAAAFATFNLRSRHDGATVLGSPILLRIELGLTAATANSALNSVVPCDLEFSGAETLGLSTVVQATTNVLSVTLVGYEYTP